MRTATVRKDPKRGLISRLLGGASPLAIASALSLMGPINSAQACPTPVFITAPTTLTTPVGCVFVTNATIEGDIVNDTTIHDGDDVGDNVVSIIDSTIAGRFINNGEISDGSLLYFNFWTRGSDIQGGIVNNGSMLSAGSAALSFGGYISGVPFSTVQTGAVDNFGSMSGTWGFSMFAGSSFLNTLTNHEGATINGTDFGILEASDENNWTGGIRNSGTISGGIVGILLQSPFAGGIVNSATGVISGGTFDGIRISGTQFLGDIDNSGRIVSTSGRGIFIPFVPSGVFAGDIVNRAGGLIEGSAGGIDVLSPGWTGNFTNAGTIRSTTGDAVHINNSTGAWGGDIVNDGLLQGGTGPVLETAGLHLDFGEWNGGILNRGTITSPAGGIIASADIWNGDFDNRGIVGGGGAMAGALIGSLTFTGTISNSATGVLEGQLTGLGICDSDCNTDSVQTGVNFIGTFFNAGRISKTGTAFDGGLPLAAVTIFANSWSGDIVNEAGGLISSPTLAVTMAKQNEFFGVGFDPLPVTTFDGDFINRGTILGTIDLSIAQWTGNFDNSGTILAAGTSSSEGVAIRLAGALSGSVSNSGVINSGMALDLAGITSPLSYRQTGATSQTSGDILLSDTAITTLDFRGGRMTGDVLGGSDLNDRFEVNAGLGGSFAYIEGVLSDLAGFAVNSGTASLGASAPGVNGNGVTMTNAGALSVAAGATLYLDDNVSIAATSATFAPGSTFAAFFTTNTAQHASISVSGSATLGGAFVAWLDPLTFSGSSQTSFLYNGVIAGPVSGTFSSVSIQGAPSLFHITGIYNSFDLLIERTSFGDLADPESPNQGSVGDALEEIYQDGTDDPDLLNLIDVIANSPAAGVSDIYDAIAGSTQAETQTTALKSDDPWKQSVGQRVNAARSTGCTVAGDTWCFKRYAQAATPVTTDVAADSDAFAWLETGLRDVGATSLWGRVVGIWGETDGGISSPGSQQRTYGLVGGADHVINSMFLVGIAGQYVKTKADFEASRNESLIEAVQGGAYFSYGGAALYVNGNASVIGTRSKTNRFFSVGAIDYNAAVRFPSTSLTGSLEAGKIFEIEGYRLEPNIGLNYAGQFTNPYREDGAGGLGLVVDPEDLHSLRSMLGGRVSRVYDVGDRKIVPELRVEWRHEYLDRRHTFQAAFQGAPDVTFLVSCEPSARDTFALGTSMTVPLTGRLTGFVDAEGAFSEDARSGTLSLGARATW